MKKPFELFPFQKDGVSFLASRTRALLADEMGLGKSVQVLSAIERCREVSEKTNILVVCPASLCLMWEKMIHDWIPEALVVQMKGVKDAVTLSGKYRFVICSYNFIQKPLNVGRLGKLVWHIIVADEAHAIKNWKSKTCKGFVKLTVNPDIMVWMLTGTPATRSGQDYYPYLMTSQIGDWDTFSQFSETYCDTEIDRWSGGRKYTGVKESKKKELRDAFSKFMLRRLKKNVQKELPPVIERIIPVRMDHSIVAECSKLDPRLVRYHIDNNRPLPAHVMTVCRSIGMGKIDSAVEFIENCGEPIVVFCAHTDVIEGIHKQLKKQAVKITGEINRENKQWNINLFQSGAVDVILCNIKAGGVGVTLTRASQVLMVETSWSPAINDQATARVDRIGQTASHIDVTYLVGHNTIDNVIMEAVKEKRGFMKSVMGDQIWAS